MIAEYVKLEELAAGRELEILEHVAGISSDLLDSKKEHPCPKCGGKTRFRLIDPARGTVYCSHCFNQGNRGFVNAVIHFAQASDYKEARQMVLDYLNGSQSAKSVQKQNPRRVKTWIYLDENGREVKKIDRYEPGLNGEAKSMYPSVFHKGSWKTKGDFKRMNKEAEWEQLWGRVAGLPLNLPGILKRKDAAVFIVEGEKCFDQLDEWGFLATTGSGGTNTKTDWAKHLTGRYVVILADNDEPGYKYALKTAQSLQGKADNIRIVFLPGLPEKGDIVDWAKAGGTKESFSDIVANAPTWDGKLFAFQKDKDELHNESIKVTRRIHMIDPSTVVEEEVEWLWHNKIPLGANSLLTGIKGQGKSFMTLYMASVITNCWDWCDGTPCPQGSVVFFANEDSISKVVKPRLRANGADQTKIRFFDRTEVFRQGQDSQDESFVFAKLEVLKDAIVETENSTGLPVLMVVFDPIGDYWGDKKENSNGETRSVLMPLQRYAEKMGFACVLIQHIGKGDKEHAQHESLGSSGISAVTRAIWRVQRDQRKPPHYYFSPVDSNYCIDPSSVEFTLNREAGGRLEFVDADIEKDWVAIKSEFFANEQRGPKTEKLGECCDWLQDFLADGAIPATEVYEKAEAAGYPKRTVDRAKKELNIESKKERFSGRWMWSILTVSEGCQVFPEEQQTGNLATFGRPLQGKDLRQQFPEGCQINPTQGNLATFAKNEPSVVVSTIDSDCGNKENIVAQSHPENGENTATQKSVEPGKMTIKTLEEMQAQINELKRIKEASKMLQNIEIHEERQTDEMKAFRKVMGEK